MITIRQITEADYTAVAGIVNDLPEWFDADARERSIPIDVQHHNGFVAIDKSEVLGFITCYVAEGRLNIGWLGVRRDGHRRGIGSLLLTRVEELATNLGIKEIATYTLGEGVNYPPYEATRRFYRARGFQVYQRSQTDNPGCPEEIRLKKAAEH